MRYWRITRNINVAIQTGSIYISDSMTDCDDKLLRESVKSDYNIERQLEIAIWPSKLK